MEPRCNHLGNRGLGLRRLLLVLVASMEPRCNHLGNLGVPRLVSVYQEWPQWSPGVITWETAASGPRARRSGSLNGAQV